MSFAWTVSDDAPWLQTEPKGSQVLLHIDPSGLSNGEYLGTVTVSPSGLSGVASVSAQVRLVVVDELHSVYVPVIKR